jgi:ABC-type nitrate/sulfonate/bicarbonate transport system substrate-binding protein
MSFPETITLLQFRAAYNLPVHAGIEAGIFARHGLTVETAYTSGSLYTSQALKDGRCDIGHTGADDIIADVESDHGSDLFIFMGLHSGLFSLVGSPDCTSIDSLIGRSIGVDAKSSGFALVLERMLHMRGFSRDDYRLIEVGGWESRYVALTEGLRDDPVLPRHMRSGESTLGRAASGSIDSIYSSVRRSDSVVFRERESPSLPRRTC